jgi:hypothetical protein
LTNSLNQKWLMEPKPYHGELSLDGTVLPVTFCGGINLHGELVLDIDPIPANDCSKFIETNWDRDPTRFVHFDLTGIAEDKTRFETSDLFFTTLGTLGFFNQPLQPKAQCSTATISWKLKQPVERPLLRIRVKAFRSFDADMTCALGQVVMAGQHTIEDDDFVTGSFGIEASSQPSDLTRWREQAGRLLKHVCRVMSFSSSTILRSPLQEYYNGDTAVLSYQSQSRTSLSGYPIIDFHDNEAVFDAAVRSFFEPPMPGSDLYFAIEWLSMEAKYNEVRLVTAMTALENLLDANLNENDAYIVSGGEFNKMRRALRHFIRKCLADVPIAEEVTSELNENLALFNRRSFLRKLKRLAEQWQVPLDGISDEMLTAAKRARDYVVHRGKYYEGAEDEPLDLWKHVAVIREVAARFLMVAVGYTGALSNLYRLASGCYLSASGSLAASREIG